MFEPWQTAPATEDPMEKPEDIVLQQPEPAYDTGYPYENQYPPQPYNYNADGTQQYVEYNVAGNPGMQAYPQEQVAGYQAYLNEATLPHEQLSLPTIVETAVAGAGAGAFHQYSKDVEEGMMVRVLVGFVRSMEDELGECHCTHEETQNN
jgi:hypothetical protein